MRLLVALLLVASVLHTQLAVGCHCQHETCCDECVVEHVGCQHGPHHGHGSLSGGECHHGQPIPVPCDGCPECEASDPVGLRMEASSELDGAALLTVWTAPPVEGSPTIRRLSQHRPSTPPDGVRSLLACGTLLRI